MPFCNECAAKGTHQNPISSTTKKCKQCTDGKLDICTGGVDDLSTGGRSDVTTTHPPFPEDSTMGQIKFSEFTAWFRTEVNTTLTNVVRKEIGAHTTALQKDITKLSTELKNTKAELEKTKDTVATLQTKVRILEDNSHKQKTISDNNLKYLINSDRNNRKLNIVVFGVPEDGHNLGINNSVSKTDHEKCSAIFDYIGAVVDDSTIRDIFRLGKPDPSKPRPIKIRFSSNLTVTSILTEGKKLKELESDNLNIYVKADKTKSEVTEFQRLGKRKQELLNQYPAEDENNPRVVLKSGVLKLDDVEVDKFKPPQTLF